MSSGSRACISSRPEHLTCLKYAPIQLKMVTSRLNMLETGKSRQISADAVPTDLKLQVGLEYE